LKLLEKNASFTDNVFHFISLEKLENDSAAKTIKISSKHFVFDTCQVSFIKKVLKSLILNDF
jgi:hypothetical protein